MRDAAVLACLLLLTNPSRGQQDSTSLGSTIGHDAGTAWRHSGLIASAPARFTTAQWFVAGGIVGTTVVLFSADGDVRNFAARNHSKVGDDLASVGHDYGNALYAVAFAGGLYGGGLVFRDRGVRETGLMLAEALAFAGITTTVIKSVAGRSRPYLDEGPHRFDPLQFNTDRTSLPSGHSTVAFAVSSTLAARLDNPYASLGLYSLALLTAASRVYEDEHWLSDTFIGAAIGTACGIATVRLHEQDDAGIAIGIVPAPNGIRAEMRF